MAKRAKPKALRQLGLSKQDARALAAEHNTLIGQGVKPKQAKRQAVKTVVKQRRPPSSSHGEFPEPENFRGRLSGRARARDGQA